MCVERYLVVVRPFSYNMEVVKRRLPACFTVIWLWGMTLCVGLVFSKVLGGRCAVYAGLGKYQGIIMDIAAWQNIFISGLIPAVVMVYCYVRIGLVLRKSQAGGGGSESKLDMSASEARKANLKAAERNIVQLCLVLVGLFWVCWLNMEIEFVLFSCGLASPADDYYKFAMSMVMFNSVVNPFVYVLRYEEFKTAAAVLFNLNKT